MLRLISKMKYLIILFCIIMIYGCSSSTKLESTYNNNEIKIDGDQSDWANKIRNVKDEGVAVGFQNDKDNLYVCLVTANRAEMMKILMMGMTVWLKPENENDIIGIRYPLKHEPGEVKEYSKEEGQDQPMQRRNTGERITRMLENQTELQILDKDGNVLNTVPVNSSEGYEAKIGYSKEQLVYELKVPVKKNSDQYAFNTGSNDEIKVGFETGNFEMDQFRNNREEMKGTPPEGGERPEGMGGLGGRKGGGRLKGNRQGNGPRFNFAQQMKFDVDLKLANQ